MAADSPPMAHDEEYTEGDQELRDVDPDEEVLPLHYSITSYGADFLVDGLVSRMTSGDIVVPTFDPEWESDSEVVGFQRDYVWKKSQADRFLESLLLGMPVPGIFLVRQPNGRNLVLDGHQRLRTIHSFYQGEIRGRPYRLDYVQLPWTGLTYDELDDEDRRRLDDTIIHATILRQDDRSDYEAVYSIFERINTGGTPLQPQEIRVALFRGPFINVLRDLNTDPAWRLLYGPRSNRLKDQELILRFFAMYERFASYKRPLKGFLNKYLADNAERTEEQASDLVETFHETVKLIAEMIGARAFRPVRPLNAAVVDSLMVAVAKRLDAGPLEDGEAVSAAYAELISDRSYTNLTESSTAAEDNVMGRMERAIEAFADV